MKSICIEKNVYKQDNGRFSFIINSKKSGYLKYTNTKLKKVLEIKEYFLKNGRDATIEKYKLLRGKNAVVKQLAMNVLLDKTLYANNKSGFDGIVWVKERNKWRVRIQLNRKRVSLGEFRTLEKAIKVRDLARQKGLEWIEENKASLKEN